MYAITSKLGCKFTRNLQVNCQTLRLLCTSAKKNVDNQLVLPRTNFNSDKSSLAKDLYAKIRLSGPISVHNYMKHVLTHPTKGYYIKKDVLGQEGDFVTSPELSQLFGEILAVWIINECSKMHNKPFQLVELGPGRGTLSRDILRVFRQLKMSNQVSLHLVEVSPVLSKIQKQTLCLPDENDDQELDESSKKHYQMGKTVDDVSVFWYKSILDIPQGFNVFIAQEFFDALPIHKFQKTKDGWFELMIDIDPKDDKQEKFRYVLTKTERCGILVDKNEKRDHVEISPDSMNIMRYISTAITQYGGFTIIIDYGHEGDKTDTFRAFRQHKQIDPLLEPGTADLTADVDFSLLKQVAQKPHKLLCFGPVLQKEFLLDLGINVRLSNLLKSADEIQRKQLEFGYNKIMSDDGMGSSFKVVSMFPFVLKNHLTKFPVCGFQGSESSQSNE